MRCENVAPLSESSFYRRNTFSSRQPKTSPAMLTFLCLGSMKSVRVYDDNGTEKVVGVPGVRTAIAIVNGQFIFSSFDV